MARLSPDPATQKGLRDRGLLLFGFASAMRRSELVALAVEDLEHTERGLLVTVRRSKTDQEGRGHRRDSDRAPHGDVPGPGGARLARGRGDRARAGVPQRRPPRADRGRA
jgi:hypothetical protein